MREPSDDPAARARHWNAAYEIRGTTEVSWFESEPQTSLAMLDALGVGPDESVIDIGGGASFLVDRLLERGHQDLTVLDIAHAALDTVAGRIGPASGVTLLHEDLLSWHPDRQFDVWHDRAVFHFLVDKHDRDRYLSLMGAAVTDEGVVILGTFNVDGPNECSGLPVRRYSIADLAALLRPHFEIRVSRSELHATPSGVDQSFTWVGARRPRLLEGDEDEQQTT